MITYSLIAFVAMILLIWFKTEAYVEYCKLFKRNDICFYKEYYKKKKDDVRLTYITYLRDQHDGFLIRLITCPICLAVWTGLLSSFLLFSPLSFPISVIGGLIVYSCVDKLLG
jgi:hypothetical protein